MRSAWTIAVFAVWLCMVVLLVRRQAPPAATPLDIADLAPASPNTSAGSGADAGDAAREEWFSVRKGEHKIGWAHRTISHDDNGYTFREDSGFTLAMLGVPQSLRTSLRARTDASYALETFDFTLISPATRFRASGNTDGHTLSVRYGPEGTEKEQKIALAEPIHLPSTLRPRLVQGHPADGSRFTASVFSPLTLQNEPLTLTVEGHETIAGPDGPVEALRISEEHQGIQAHAWLAPDGSTIREEAILGFTLERANAQSALAGIERDAPVDIALASQIPFTGDIANPREAARLTMRLAGPAADRVPNDPPRQRRSGDRLEIVREDVPRDLPPGLPLRPTDAAVAELAEPSPFIESDDPAIVSTARAIVGDERDPVRAARRLVEWVNDNLKKEPAMTVPSARAVIESRSGDCNEHAVLLAALARAAGIPARVAAGAMYGDGGFFYHAWVELWLGRWVSADAVFRQMPVDVTHVKLLEGGPERHMALAEVIGQLSFTAVETGS